VAPCPPGLICLEGYGLAKLDARCAGITDHIRAARRKWRDLAGMCSLAFDFRQMGMAHSVSAAA
jgi:hypothetical protein